MKDCKSRIRVNRADSTAFRDLSDTHSSHESQYESFKYMYCDSMMKEKAKSSPASMTPYNIYVEVVAEYVWNFVSFLFKGKYPFLNVITYILFYSDGKRIHYAMVRTPKHLMSSGKLYVVLEKLDTGKCQLTEERF